MRQLQFERNEDHSDEQIVRTFVLTASSCMCLNIKSKKLNASKLSQSDIFEYF